MTPCPASCSQRTCAACEATRDRLYRWDLRLRFWAGLVIVIGAVECVLALGVAYGLWLMGGG